MSIQSAVGNITSNVTNDLQSLLITAKTNIQNIVGSVSTGLSAIWSGGFAGIDENNFEILKNALIKYCDDLDEHINGFNQEGRLQIAYKGAIQEAANEFVIAVKDILTAYVSTMRRNIAEADTAFQNYKQAAQSIAQDIRSDAQAVRDEASKIRIE